MPNDWLIAPCGLRIGPGVIHHDFVAAHVDFRREAVGRVGQHAIVLDDPFRRIGAVGHARDRLPHHHFGHVLDLLRQQVEAVDAQAVDEVHDAPLGQIGRPHHRHQVAARHLGRAHVGRDDREDVLDRLVVLVDLDRRQPQALLEDVARIAEGRRHHAADIGHVRDVGRVGHHLVLVEAGLQRHELRHVAAAAIGIVVEDHVARMHVFGPTSLMAHSTVCTIAPMCAGQKSPWAIIWPAAVEDHAGEVARLVEHRRVRGAQHGRAHLLAGADQVVARDFELDRVVDIQVGDAALGGCVLHHLTPPPESRCPCGSTRADQSGGTIAVASSSTIIAGPWKVVAGAQVVAVIERRGQQYPSASVK